MELIEKLAALTPRPRINLILYHGVLAPHARWRARVVAYGALPAIAERLCRLHSGPPCNNPGCMRDPSPLEFVPLVVSLLVIGPGVAIASRIWLAWYWSEGNRAARVPPAGKHLSEALLAYRVPPAMAIKSLVCRARIAA